MMALGVHGQTTQIPPVLARQSRRPPKARTHTNKSNALLTKSAQREPHPVTKEQGSPSNSTLLQMQL